jgi:ornithine--oxo-acid transaminase
MIANDGLEKRATELGKHFRSRLEAVHAPAVKEVRGRGLLIGVEIKPEYPKARWFCEKFLKDGILCKDAHEDVIRFAPPLVIEKTDIDWAMERIAPVLLSAERVK